jgi:hypothetical protein
LLLPTMAQVQLLHLPSEVPQALITVFNSTGAHGILLCVLWLC